MFYWMKPLPRVEIGKEYKPFIKSDWFRANFMWFVYALQLALTVFSICTGVFSFSKLYVKLLILVAVYLVHELLHIVVVFRQGNISLTHSGIFFWLNTDAKMSKMRFWMFMTLPILVLTVIPCILMFAVSGGAYPYLRYIAWINAIIAGADIINSFLILIKPRKAIFYRGFYLVEKK